MLSRHHFWAYFVKYIFVLLFFFSIDYWQTYRCVGKYIRVNIKNSFYISRKFDERLRKGVRRMSLGTVRIMKFYGRPEKDILTHSIKFVTTTFLKYSFSVPSGSKNNWIDPISQKKFRQTSQWCPNCVLK